MKKLVIAITCVFALLNPLLANAAKDIKTKTIKSQFSKTKNKKFNLQQAQVKPEPKIEKLVLDNEALANLFKIDVRKDTNFLTALDRSIEYFTNIQDKNIEFKYDAEIYSPKEMLESMLLFRDITQQDATYEEFLGEIGRLFDIYAVNNYKSQSIFTGYFTPKLEACMTQGEDYKTPLYLQDGSKIFVKSLHDAKEAAMEGASILKLNNGDTKVITYAKTDYIPIKVKITKIANKINKKQKKVIYMTKTIKQSRALFQETDEPMGSIATPLTPGYSAAMDSKYTPIGSLIYVYNEKENGEEPFQRFMLVQDVGGAIKGPGRIDIYLGEGKEAKQDTFTLAKKGSVLMLVAKKDALENNYFVSLQLPRGENE